MFGTVIIVHVFLHSILFHSITSLAFLKECPVALSGIPLEATDTHDAGFDAGVFPSTTHSTSEEREV